MSAEFIQTVAENGLLGILLALALITIFWLYKTGKADSKLYLEKLEEAVVSIREEGRKERQQMLSQYKEQHNQLIELGDKFNTTTRETISLVSEIRGILQSRK